jgi:hypothetical protein
MTLKTAILLLLAFAPLVSRAQEGTVFPSNKLSSEESGYLSIFADGILEVTTYSYQSYHSYMESRTYSDLGDPGNAASREAAFLRQARAARVSAKKLVKDLEYYIPPARFEAVHAVLHEFATDRDRPMHERGPSCLRVYTQANDLKHEMRKGPDQWVPTSTAAPSSPMDVIFTPVGLPVRYNLTKGTFSLATSLATPIGSFTFSVPVTPTPGVSRASAKVVVFEYEGRGRAFALDRAINIVSPSTLPLKFDGFQYTTDKGHAVVRISRCSSADQQVPPRTGTLEAPLKALEVTEEEAME